MNYLLLLTILTLIKSQAAVSSESEPDMVVEIFRHGARAPSDLKYDNSWPVHGELTSVGMRQLYVLGVAIARKYPNLLKEYSPKEIFIRSSNFNRTIMSASAHLYGVFQGKGPTIPLGSDIDLISPPFEDQELIDEINAGLENVPESIASGFQPLVIQVVNKPDDRVIFVGPWNCDKVAVWQEARFKDRLNQEVYEYFQGTISQLKSLGYEVNSMMDLFIFGDTLIDNHADMRPLPKGIEYGSTLYNDSVFAFKWFSTYNFVGTGTERVIKSLTLLNQIVEWFKGVVNKTNPLKFAFLSAHDTTLLPLLGLYSLTNASCLFQNYKSEKLGKPVPYPECVYPEFASQMIYELYNKPEGPYIKVLFNGKPIKICNKDKFECSLNEFVEQTRNVLMGYLPQDYVKLCDASGPKEVDHDTPTKESPNFWYVFIIIALLCVVGGLVYLLVMQKKQLQTQEESNGCYKAEDQEMKEIILIRKTSGV